MKAITLTLALVLSIGCFFFTGLHIEEYGGFMCSGFGFSALASIFLIATDLSKGNTSSI